MTTALIVIGAAVGVSVAVAGGALARRNAYLRGWIDGYYTGWEAKKDCEAAARRAGIGAVQVRTGGHFQWAGWEGPCTPD